MQTNMTILSPAAPADKTIGPNRYLPPIEAAPPAHPFAELLQRRREAQPPAKAPQPAPQREPKSEPKAKPIARAPGDDEAHRNARDMNAVGREDRPADDATPKASSGCTASEPQTPGKTPTRSAANGEPDSDATDGSNQDAATPAVSSADPSFWPGMSAAVIDAAKTAHDASAVSGNGTLDLRIGVAGGTTAPGTAGTPAAGSALAGGAAGNAGEHGASRQSAGDQDADTGAGHAAALLAAAASNAESTATASAAGDRFALPPRTTDVTLPGSAGGIAAHRLEGSAPSPVALPTPLTAPDFAKALGAQVSLFARNGLAQAELQLTPAEMGPIRVQIAINGAHARVDFAADSAATRQVIERGLPELASALREQGLTLSGGGVFQRAPDQSDDREAKQANQAIGRARRRGTAAAVGAVAPQAPLRTRATREGGVDLYA